MRRDGKMKHFIKFRNGVIRVDSIDAMTKRRLLDDCYVSIYAGSNEFSESFTTEEERDKRYEELIKEIEEYYLSRKVLLTLNAIREQYGLNPIDMGDAAIIEKSLLHAR